MNTRQAKTVNYFLKAGPKPIKHMIQNPPYCKEYFTGLIRTAEKNYAWAIARASEGWFYIYMAATMREYIKDLQQAEDNAKYKYKAK